MLIIYWHYGIVEDAQEDSITVKYDNEILYEHYNTVFHTQHLYWNEFEIPKEAFIKPLPQLAVDTKVIVWDDNGNSHKQHFKEFKNGKIVCFILGRTSFTAHDDSDETLWNNWELYEEEDV